MDAARTGYDLWDRFDGSAVADFDELRAAVDFVRAQIEEGGPESVRRLALCEVTDEGRTSKVLAEGDDLVALVQKGTTARH